MLKAVITGGAKGLGLSNAEKFHEEGCQIIICDILSSEAKKVAKNLQGKFFLIRFVRFKTSFKCI